MITYKVSRLPDGIQIESSIGQSVLSKDITKLLDFLANQPKADFKLFWDLDNSLALLFKDCDTDLIENIARKQSGITRHLAKERKMTIEIKYR